MIRHPHYLDIPWDIHWQKEPSSARHFWWLVVAVTLLALFLVGVGVISGTS